MPRTAVVRKSFKTVCVDTVLFFALFALVGHLSINFWEKYTLQNELVTMKHSLHSLKDTITNIGKAYDHLYTELREVFKMVDENHICLEKKEPNAKCKNIYNLNHRGQHDLHVQTVITNANRKKTAVGVTTEGSKQIERYGHEHMATGPLGKSLEHKATEPLGKNSTHEHMATSPLGKNATHEHKATEPLGENANHEHKATGPLDKNATHEHKATGPLGKGYEHKATGPLGKNATTNTKNPPVDMGTTTDDQSSIDQITEIPNTSKPIDSNQSRHIWYKDLEHCRHVCRQSKLKNFRMQSV